MAMLRPCDNQTKPHYPPTRAPFTLCVYAVAGVYATRSDIANYVTVIMVMLGNRRYRPCDDSERIPNPNYVSRFTFYVSRFTFHIATRLRPASFARYRAMSALASRASRDSTSSAMPATPALMVTT